MKPLQLSMSYLPEEDRILLLIGTPDGEEYRFILTRRLVKSLVPALAQLMGLTPDENKPSETGPLDLQSARMQYEHQKAIEGSNFEEAFHSEADSSFPLGETPVLINGFVLQEQPNGFMLVLRMVNGKEMNMTLPQEVVHSLYKLFADTIQNAEWDIPLQLSSTLNKPQDMNKLM